MFLFAKKFNTLIKKINTLNKNIINEMLLGLNLPLTLLPRWHLLVQINSGNTRIMCEIVQS